MTGIDIVHVPYKGLAPAITDVLGGQLQILFADVSLIAPHLKAGKLKALAVTSKTLDVMPELPTMIENGHSGYQAGMVRPSCAWDAERNRLATQRGASQDHRDAGDQDAVAVQGIEPRAGGDQFAALIRDDTSRWGKLVRMRT